MKSDKNIMEIDYLIEFMLKNHIFLINLAIFFKNFVNKKSRLFCYFRRNFSNSFRSIQAKLICALNFSSNFTLFNVSFGKKYHFFEKFPYRLKSHFWYQKGRFSPGSGHFQTLLYL